MKTTVISFFTKGTSYAREVKDLIASCMQFQVPYIIEEVESRGSWEQNCAFKAEFILEKLKRLQNPIVWIDADAILVKKPTLFDTLTCDLAVRVHEDLPDRHPSKLITGTLFVNPTQMSFKILEKWKNECEKCGGKEWDQVCLKNVLKGHEFFSLPPEYCTIYDKAHDSDKTVILHYQASRLFKKEVNGELIPFFQTGSLKEIQKVPLFEEK